MMTKTTLTLLLLYVTLLNPLSIFGQDADKPSTYKTVSGDPEMEEAIASAKATFDEFVKALEEKDEKNTFFSIKLPFKTSTGHEHIWLSYIEKREGAFWGLIDNLPNHISGFEIGDRVKIDPEAISDWFYINRGKLIGGYTIRVIRDRMSPKEREQFDQAYGLVID
ncbi:DUF2314 domain-containing protein [Limibacter armeniacum]|uniref:YegJ family protein n=1 Tax=Limibacter armeniacum TaxID=466084 RepID=UPI002FE61ABD